MKIDSISSPVYDSLNSAQTISGKTSANSASTASSGTQNSTSSGVTVSISDYYYDVRDLNKDGVVSLEEELLYALTHGRQLPGQAAALTGAEQSAAANYNQQGNVTAEDNKTQGQINIIV